MINFDDICTSTHDFSACVVVETDDDWWNRTLGKLLATLRMSLIESMLFFEYFNLSIKYQSFLDNTQMTDYKNTTPFMLVFVDDIAIYL